jgi:hypothetical protein
LFIPTARRRFLASATTLCALVAALAVCTTATAGAPRQTSAIQSATFLSSQIAEAPDYASSVFDDPWDYSDSADVLLDKGPAEGVVNASYAGGVLTYSMKSSSYISPLFAGYSGSLVNGRNGTVATNQINTATFTRMHLHAYSSKTVPAGLMFFTTAAGHHLGSLTFQLHAGWHDYDFKMANNMAGKQPWVGRMQGLRFAVSGNGPTTVKLDFLRLYQPAAASHVVWQSPDGTTSQLFWSDGTESPSSPDQHGGWVTNAAGNTATAGSSPVSTDVSGYPAGTVFYARSAGGTVTALDQRLSVTPKPMPVVDSPGAMGCSDYATTALGHPWNFTSRARSGQILNASNLVFSKNGLSATNAGPDRGDPHILLPLGKGGIDGRRWHILTITESYSGPFNLGNGSGGGTLARVMWSVVGDKNLSQTNDIVTYYGNQTLTINMAQPTSILTEPDARKAGRYAFAQSKRVDVLRYDPNEDTGARRWHITSIRLARDCSATTSFPVVWHDPGFSAGSHATIVATSPGKVTRILSTGHSERLDGGATARHLDVARDGEQPDGQHHRLRGRPAHRHPLIDLPPLWRRAVIPTVPTPMGVAGD